MGLVEVVKQADGTFTVAWYGHVNRTGLTLEQAIDHHQKLEKAGDYGRAAWLAGITARSAGAASRTQGGAE